MRAIVVANGEPAPGDLELLEGADLVIAADGGAAWLDGHGLTPAAVVGDLDSIHPALVARYADDGVNIERYPPDKDASDAELAVLYAAGAGADPVLIVGALAGARVDHALANVLLLVHPRLRGRDVRIVGGMTTIRAVGGGERVILDGQAGDLVTLLAIGGSVAGVTTTGLRYPLAAEGLTLGASRGLSNVIEDPPASVRVEAGTLLVIELKKGAAG